MRNGTISLRRRILATSCRGPLQSAAPTLRWSSTAARRTWSTPLAKTIAEAIETTGPISIASYMRQCLTSPDGGYYTTTRERSDQFGRKGDFITSPEISQVFGELVGVWFVTEWMAQGRRAGGVQLIEVGPGRGTLIDDVLRTISTFKAFADSIEVVYLVEASEGLREAQKRLLCGDEAKMDKTEMGWRCPSKYWGTPVEWVEEINLLPKDEEKEKMPFIVAHEFFDALPIHAFESVPPSPVRQGSATQLLDAAGRPLPTRRPPTPAATAAAAAVSPQWRELLVTPTSEGATPTPLENGSNPDFHLTRAPSPTPISLLWDSLPRYKALRSQPGSSIEISPDSSRHIADFALRIGGPAKSPTPSSSSRRRTGAALVIDYGPSSTVPVNSLRGIKAHKRVSPFSEPGSVDLSADVDFTALAEAATNASDGVEVWGPVQQGDFLVEMGGEVRVQQLIKGLEKKQAEREKEKEKKKRSIEDAWKRLVDKRGPQGMGRIYKALALVPEGAGTRAPVGFGGELRP